VVIAAPVNTPEAWTERAIEFPEPWTACGWSFESQGVRFDRVIDALDPRSGEWLLDWGCGCGDLSLYVELDIGYYGFDWSPGMVARAAGEHGRENRRFKTYEPPAGHHFDVVAAIGPFNLLQGWSKERTGHTLRRLWDTTTCRALAVCLYAGTDANCITYNEAECEALGRQLGFHATVERILPNDLMLVVRR
jgi:hypothetical protein